MTTGLTLPFLTAPDPDVMQEGSLDPLGMGRLADSLANEIAPEVTARMSRIRFLTAMAVGARAVEQPAEWMAEDGTPAFLAFEWLVVEAFARTPAVGDVVGVPGIQKARRAVQGRRHVGSGDRYLAAPKVFGFHGVYKRITIDLGVVDDRLELLPGRGEQLVDAWRADQGARRDVRLARDLIRIKHEVAQALAHGEIRLGPTSSYWQELARWFAPGTAGPTESRLIWDWLVAPVQNGAAGLGTDLGRRLRAEAVLLLRDEVATSDDERALLLRLLARTASRELRQRLEAIESFEALARRLDDAFRLLRVRSSERLPSARPVAELATHGEFRAIAAELPALSAEASRRLNELDLGAQLEDALGIFRDARAPAQLVQALLDHHQTVQDRKVKRPWFERLDEGVVARGPGRSFEPYSPRATYVHPYRLLSLRSFCRDLRQGRPA